METTVLLETKRIVLRPFRLEDAEDAFAINQDPRVTCFIPEEFSATIEQVRQLMKQITLSDYEEYGYGRLALMDKNDGHFMRFAGLKILPNLQEVDLGYRLIPPHWGRGLATEAAQALVRYGFETLGLNRIIAMAMRDNTRSIRVMKKSGMRFWKAIQNAGHKVVVYQFTGPSPALRATQSP